MQFQENINSVNNSPRTPLRQNSKESIRNNYNKEHLHKSIDKNLVHHKKITEDLIRNRLGKFNLNLDQMTKTQLIRTKIIQENTTDMNYNGKYFLFFIFYQFLMNEKYFIIFILINFSSRI